MKLIGRLISKIPFFRGALRKIQTSAIVGLLVALATAAGVDLQFSEAEIGKAIAVLWSVAASFIAAWAVPESAAKIKRLIVTK